MKIVFVYIDPNFEEIFDFGNFIGLVVEWGCPLHFFRYVNDESTEIPLIISIKSQTITFLIISEKYNSNRLSILYLHYQDLYYLPPISYTLQHPVC